MKKFKGLLFCLVAVLCFLVPVSAFAAAGDITDITAKVGNTGLLTFSKGNSSYNVLVDKGDDLNIEARADFSAPDLGNYIKITSDTDMSSSSSGNVSLKVGNINDSHTIRVESYDAQTGNSASYTIYVGINPGLKSLTVNGKNPEWNYDRYEFTTPSNNGAVEIAATASNGGSVNISANSFTLVAGNSREVSITITSPTGHTQTYRLLVARPLTMPSDNNLKSLTLSHTGTASSAYPSSGNWDRAFSSSRTSYYINVATNAANVKVYPATNDSAATYTIRSGSKSYGAGENIPVASSGYSTITIEVKAQNGSLKTYSLNVSRGQLSDNCELSNLYLRRSSTTLDMFPKFEGDNTGTYYFFVPSNVSSVQVYPTASDKAASIYVNGTKVNSGSSTSVSVSSTSNSGNKITVEVTAQDGVSKKTYDIVVRRASSSASSNAELEDLTIRSGTSGSSTIDYDPTFRYNTYTYDAYVSTSVRYVRILPEVDTKGAVVLVDGELVVSPTQTSATSGSISLSSGTTKINVVVYAADYSKKNTYVVNINRGNSTNNYLSGLTMREPGGNLSFAPKFARGTTSYSITVANDIDRVSFRPVAEDSSASIRINNSTASNNNWSSYINLAEGDNNITITVTSSSGLKRNYTVKVTRERTVLQKNIYLKIGQRTATVGTEQITIDAAPFLYRYGQHNYTMVPLRFIAQSMGAEVHYHGNATYKITIALGGKTLTMYANGKADSSIGMDAPPVIISGRTYVPLRYVGEQLNATVNWHQADQSITIIPK